MPSSVVLHMIERHRDCPTLCACRACRATAWGHTNSCLCIYFARGWQRCDFQWLRKTVSSPSILRIGIRGHLESQLESRLFKPLYNPHALASAAPKLHGTLCPVACKDG